MARLVEILSKELHSWPQGDRGNDGISQDGTGELNSLDKGRDPSFHEGDKVWMARSHSYLGETLELASDYATAVVSKAQWQAERDRQKGGKWKRHRGGKCPVQESQEVEVRFRDGEIEASYASDFFGWEHGVLDDKFAEIMAYRVISQPQAEEVEVITDKKWYEPEEDPDTREYKGPFPCAPAGEPVTELEWDIQFQQGIFHMEAKTDQIDGPILWRDTVNELDAYIEEFTREREALIQRLADEGFVLIQPITGVRASEPAVDMSDWRNLKEGDIIQCGTDGWSISFEGVRVTVKDIERVDYTGSLPINGVDDNGDDDWGESYTFISRP
jgi:hypothetical protein